MESNQLNNNPNEEAVIEALTLECHVDKDGDKFYFNKDGEYHRIHGPAVVYENLAEFWYKNDKLHREDGPAVTYADGDESYYINDKLLTKKQFIKWQKDNEITPLDDTTNEDTVAELLTLDCVIEKDGTKVYYNKEGKLHRIHGPAIVYTNGIRCWYKNGKRHREGGPAITWPSGNKEYWLDSIQYNMLQYYCKIYFVKVKKCLTSYFFGYS